MLVHELNVACRSLLRRPTLSAGVVVTLALGIGATTTVYSVVDGVVLRPLPYESASRLATVGSLPPTSRGLDPATGIQDLAPMTSVDLDRLVRNARSFERIAAVGPLRMLVADENGVEESVAGASVGADFFSMVGASPALGRTFLSEEFEFPEELGSLFGNAVLITHGYWQRRYGGDPDVLGRPLEPDATGPAAAVIVGVLPEGFRPPEPFFAPDEVPEVYTPLQLPPTDGPQIRVRGNIRALALLQPSVTVEAAREEVARIAEELGAPLAGGMAAPGAGRRSLGVNGLHAETVGTTASTLWVFLGATALLLALATLNAASLLLARALDRERELGVRAALGAGRGRLLRLLLYEAGVLTMVGAALGVVAANVGLDVFHRFAPLSIPRLADVTIDARVLAVAGAVAAVTGMVAGLLPALRMTGRDPWAGLREGGRSVSDASAGLRSALVGGQLALALMLLAGAGLLFNSFMRLRTADPGFDPAGLVTMAATPSGGIRVTTADIGGLWQRWDPVVERLSAVPGVSGAAGTSGLPFQAPSWAPRILLPGDDPQTVRDGIAGYAVTPGYLETVGTEVVRGRGFLSSDGADAEGVAVVNEAFVRTQMDGADPLGMVLQRATEGLGASGEIVPLRVVGVVRDVVQARLEDGPRPAVYIPYTQADPAQLVQWRQVVRTDLPPSTVVPELRRVLSEAGQLPRELATMDERISLSRTTPRFQALLIGAFGAVATLLAALGLYGSLAETVRRLRRELGIRMALGADGPALVRMVAGQGLRLTLVGLGLGLLGTLALSRVLASFLFGVQPTDPLTLILVALLLVLVAAVACVVPARRATTLDPVDVLKAE